MSLDNLKALAKRIEQMKGMSVVAGIPKSEASKADEGITVLEKAVIHELGTIHIPERSFLRSTFSEERNNAVKILGVDAKKFIIEGGDINIPFANAGRYLVGKIQDKIIAGIEPALDPATIKQKGSSKPLIDTGQLLNSITYEVRNNDA